MDYEALAAAFMLLHGNPPKSLRYRFDVFAKTDAKAATYYHDLTKYLKCFYPEAMRTRRLEVIETNKVMRAVYEIMGIESK